MFTIDQINNQVLLFAKHTKIGIPYFDEVIYNHSQKDYAHVDSKDILNSNYIIYISHELDKFDLDYQISVLWHEFIHVADYIRFSKQFSNVNYIIKTCSEAFATSTQLEYLQSVSKTPNQILYKGEVKTLQSVARNFFNISAQYAQLYMSTQHPDDFNGMMSNFCYFCGTIIWFENSSKILQDTMQVYPEPFQNQLLYIGNAILANNHQFAGDLYGSFYESQKKQALQKIEAQIKNIDNQIKNIKK